MSLAQSFWSWASPFGPPCMANIAAIWLRRIGLALPVLVGLLLATSRGRGLNVAKTPQNGKACA